MKNEKKYEPSQNPPDGLSVEETPQFVIFGFDDNGVSGLSKAEKEGISFLTELFGKFQNPGNGNSATFDGESGTFSFYVNTKYVVDSTAIDNVENVKTAWVNAVKAGNEIGNHTHSHPNGVEENFSIDDWKNEMEKCSSIINSLFEERGITLNKTQQNIGFRTPYIAYNQATFKAVEQMGFIYDCTMQGGAESFVDGTNNYWPYYLPKNIEISDTVIANIIDNKNVEYSNVIEVPAFQLVVPPDSLCEKYGVKPGFRAKMDTVSTYYKKDNKLAGFDWNLFVEFGLSKDEVLALCKYNLDLRLSGNRAPFIFCGHGDIYADNYNDYNRGTKLNTTGDERRQFFREFFEYLKTKKEVRVVSTQKFIEWYKNPKAL